MRQSGSTLLHTQTCRAIKGYLNAIGAYHCKNLGGVGQVRGRPDIDACIQGRFVGIEVKTGDAELSFEQKEQRRLIEKAGGLFLEVHDLEELEHALIDAGLVKKRLVLALDWR